MKIIFTTLILFFTFISFSQTKDTVFKYDLNFDGKEESIKIAYNIDALQFTLHINNTEVSAKYMDSYDIGVEIIDINRNDNLREILVKGYGSSDQTDMYFYQFIDNKIVPCGHLPSNFGIEVSGNNEITEYAWMGFWTAKLKYDFDSRNKTITKVSEEFYEVNQDCVVKNPFKLLLKKEDNSEAVVTLTPKTKLTIVKADISPLCKYDNGDDDDFSCDWYLFKTADGTMGWCRLKDFQQNVDGLIWAG